MTHHEDAHQGRRPVMALTALSVAPQLWAASGLPYPELLDHLIRLALERPVGLR